MSEGELEKLADLIVDKLVEKQKQLDDEYMQKMLDEQQEHMNSSSYEVKHFYTLSSDATATESNEGKIKALEEALADAIKKEDYLRAADIQTNITKLRDEGTAE